MRKILYIFQNYAQLMVIVYLETENQFGVSEFSIDYRNRDTW